MKTAGKPSMGMTDVVRRSCVYYWPGHLLLLLAIAVCTAVVAGALIVGDSVRATLRTVADQRLGRVQYAWSVGDRLFREILAEEVQKGCHSKGGATAVLSLAGVASSHDGGQRTGGIRVLGVQASFSLMSPAGFPVVTGNTVAVNRRLAGVLSLRVGDELVLRIERPDALRELALEPSGRATVACRLPVGAIVEDGELGRFGLENTQVPPLNAFVDLALLQKLTGTEGQANLLLFAGIDAGDAVSAIRGGWDFPDGGLEWRTVGTPPVGELRSRSIFLDERVGETARMVSSNCERVLTYLVTSMTAGDKATPYAFVAGVESAPGGGGMEPGEMVVTDWLADDLGVTAGDAIELRSYAMGALRTLAETTNRFRVKSVVPLAGLADSSLMPFIPGLTDAGSCAEWSTGIPIDFGKVRAKDEAYWDRWKGAPKAFIRLDEARRLWGNRWGSLTAVRYRGTEAEREDIRETLRVRLAGGVMSPVLRAVHDEANRAGHEALDFGQLFLGLSFFLVVSSVILMALLFGLAGEQRMEQTGILLAVGFDPAVLRRWAMGESLLTAFAGAVLGCAGGVGYARGLLWLLETRWHGEAPLGLEIHVSWISLVTATAVTLLMAVLINAVVSRRFLKMQPRNLMDELIEESGWRRRWAGKVWSAVGWAALAMAGVTAWVAYGGGHEGHVEAFFAVGAGLLVAGFSLMRRWIDVWGCETAAPPTGLLTLARRNAGRHVKRSFMVSGLTACAVFLLVAVALFEPASDVSEGRQGGTGGYGLMVKTSVPVTANLNLERERQRRGLDGVLFKDVVFTGIRVTGGDAAGCENLQRAQRPRLAGVDSHALARRKAFRFINFLSGSDSVSAPPLPAGKKDRVKESPWMLLDKDYGDAVVPAVADEATLMWGLAKQVGDELVYEDERGTSFRLRFVGMIANSVLQGHVIVPERMLARRFPSEAGVRLVLVDVPPAVRAGVADVLSRQLGDDGAEVLACDDRLRQLNAVTVLYIRLFQLLGGLGLLLGGLGVAVVIARNGIERRGELALLRAAGFSRTDGVVLLAGEQVWLMGLGIVTGCLCAVASVWPLMAASQAVGWSVWVVPGYGFLSVAIGGVVASVLTALWVMRGAPWEALRLE